MRASPFGHPPVDAECDDAEAWPVWSCDASPEEPATTRLATREEMSTTRATSRRSCETLGFKAFPGSRTGKIFRGESGHALFPKSEGLQMDQKRLPIRGPGKTLTPTLQMLNQPPQQGYFSFSSRTNTFMISNPSAGLNTIGPRSGTEPDLGP